MSEGLFPDDPLLTLARERFGIAALTPLQRYVVANTLDGISQLVVLPTGAGKSVCFQLPSLVLDGATLVVVPLLSLLQDQVRRLAGSGVAVEVIRGGQTDDERKETFSRLSSRTSRIAFATPEILENAGVVFRLAQTGIGHFVIDEAHCVSEWGKTFRPSYRALPQAVRALGNPLVSAFTATATAAIVEDIGELFFTGRDWKLLNEIPDRPNLSYRVIPALSKNMLVTRLARECARPMVIFTRSRDSAELSARLLRRRLATDDVYFYHAGLSKSERKNVEAWFFGSRTGILCATSAYGMGIDKPNIRTIVHRDVPPSVEAYLQESGRAGRDGLPSAAVLVRGHEDEVFLDALQTQPGRDRYQTIFNYADGNTGCRRASLLKAFGHEAAPCAEALCDVCAKEADSKKEGEAEILFAVKKNPRRFATRELVALLKGGTSYLAKKNELTRRPGFGLLSGWDRADIEDSLNLLAAMKKIRVPRRGFFRFRYRPGRRS